MRSKARLRRLFLEPLEQRYLLAGNVTASLVAGDLVVLGDEADNGFTVEQLVAPPDPTGGGGGSGGVLITPDATTSLNGLPPGQPWKTDGVVSNVHIDVRGGQDQVQVVGAEGAVLDNLIVASGDGSDSLTLQDLRVSKRVHAIHYGGNARVTILNTAVDGDLTVESPRRWASRRRASEPPTSSSSFPAWQGSGRR